MIADIYNYDEIGDTISFNLHEQILPYGLSISSITPAVGIGGGRFPPEPPPLFFAPSSEAGSRPPRWPPRLFAPVYSQRIGWETASRFEPGRGIRLAGGPNGDRFRCLKSASLSMFFLEAEMA